MTRATAAGTRTTRTVCVLYSLGCGRPLGQMQRWCWLVQLAVVCAYELRRINESIVDGSSPPEVFADMSKVEDKALRYFTIVEPGSGEKVSPLRGIVLAGRGGHGSFWPHDETWNMQLLEETTHYTTTVIWDRGFASNGFIRKFNSTYYAFG